MYYWSKFNKVFFNKENKPYIFNSLTKVFIELDDSTFENLEKIQTQFEKSNYNSQNPLHEELLKMGIISVFSHKEIINNLKLQYLKSQFKQNTLALTLIPTQDCNFNCTYCYETERPAIYMQEEVKNKIIEYILNRKNDFKNIQIDWYGGEPLLNYDCIISISEELLKNNINFHASIVTNGFLLTNEIIKTFPKYQIKSMQVTIDGLGDDHNQRRPLKDGKNTFEQIINNLKEFKKFNENLENRIRVVLRINIDKTNIDKYYHTHCALQELFPESQIGPGIIKQYNECNTNSTHCLNKNEYANFLKELYYKFNLRINNFFPEQTMGQCMAHKLSSFIIGPSGELYKCWANIGDKKMELGNLISSEIIDTVLLSKFMLSVSPFEDNQCLNCYFLPICAGGCPYDRYLRLFENNQKDICSYYKNNLEEFLDIHSKIKEK